MTAAGATTVALDRCAPGLRRRLRVETAEWHNRVDAAVDRRVSIGTRDDYVDLLILLYDLHMGFESHLGARVFQQRWCRIGVDIGQHLRAYLLASDLDRLGLSPPSRWTPVDRLPSFGHALGCLYVLEGSSLGGRMIAGVVEAAIGEVPTTFLTGQSRSHPAPWASVCSALTLFDELGGDGDAVVSGACATFAAFAERLGRAPTAGLNLVAVPE